MANEAAETVYGLPVENGRIRCHVTVRFGIFRPGRKYGFTIPEIEAELAKREPRFLPDNGDRGECESLMGIPGMTAADEAFLYSRGVLTPASVAFPGERGERAGLEAFYRVDPAEESRRRKLVRHFQEKVHEKGLEGALSTDDEDEGQDHLMALNDALTGVADGDTMTQETYGLLADHLLTADLEALADPLKAAFSAVAGSPGNRKPETLAKGLLEALIPAG